MVFSPWHAWSYLVLKHLYYCCNICKLLRITDPQAATKMEHIHMNKEINISIYLGFLVSLLIVLYRSISLFLNKTKAHLEVRTQFFPIILLSYHLLEAGPFFPFFFLLLSPLQKAPLVAFSFTCKSKYLLKN